MATMALTIVTVHGQFLKPVAPTSGTPVLAPAKGRVSFVLSTALQDPATEEIVAPVHVSVSLDDTGSFVTKLVATDDVGVDPQGATYLVTESIRGANARTYSITIPHTVTDFDLAEFAPVISGPLTFGYALQSALVAEETTRALDDAATLAASEAFATGAVGFETSRALVAEATKAAITYVDAHDAATLASADTHADSGDATHAASSTAHPASHVTVASGAGVTSPDVQAAIGEITGMIQSQEAGDSAAIAAVATGLADEIARAESIEAGKQAHDADLDTIAALDSTVAGAIATDGGGWIRKTYAQLKTALVLVKADVGLGNVDNTSDVNKPISSPQQAALDAKAATTYVDAQDIAVLGAAESFASGVASAAQAASQPVDSDLTAIAALTTTAFGRALLALADGSALRTAAGTVIGTDVQAHDSDLDAIAALTTTAFGRSVLDRADAAALRTLAGLVIGSDVQAQDAELSAIAGLVSAADKLPYFTGSGTAALTTLSTFIRTLLDDADAATAQATLGLGSAATHPSTDFAPSTGIAESAVTNLVTDLAGKLVAGSTATYPHLSALPAASGHTNEIVKTTDGGVYESTGSAWVQLVPPSGTYALPTDVTTALTTATGRAVTYALIFGD